MNHTASTGVLESMSHGRSAISAREQIVARGPATFPFQYFFRLVDVVALELAFYLAYLTVLFVRWTFFSGATSIQFDAAFSATLLSPLVWLMVMQALGLYGDPARAPYFHILTRMFLTAILSPGIVMLVLFAVKQSEMSRLLFFISGIYGFAILTAVHAIEKAYFVMRHQAGYYSERLVVIGNTADLRKVERAISIGDSLKSYEVVGRFDLGEDVVNPTDDVRPLPSIDELKREITRREVSEVVLVWDPASDSKLASLIEACREAGIGARVIPRFALDYGGIALSPVSARPEPFWGIASVMLSTVHWPAEQEFLKRLIDIAVSATLLVILSPILLAAALAVRLSSPGPIFYKWKVLGKNNRDFVGYKFRTMVANADDLKAALADKNEMKGAAFKMKDDPRVTRVGRFLRQYSLDELPQLWSVLKGDMSLVGPRPPCRAEVDRYEFWQHRKVSVRPGITCLWQVRGRNRISDFSEWVRLDLEYIDNWSLLLDLKILLKTIPAVLRGTGV